MRSKSKKDGQATVLFRCLCTLNLPGTQAAGANVHALMRAIHNCFYPTNVGLPGSVGLTVGVGNVMTEYQALAANFTLCHFKHLLKRSHPKMPFI